MSKKQKQEVIVCEINVDKARKHEEKPFIKKESIL